MRTKKKKTSVSQRKKRFVLTSYRKKENSWELLIVGGGVFLILSYFMYGVLIEEPETTSYKDAQRYLIQMVIMILLFSVVAYNFTVEKVSSSIQKINSKESLNKDEIAGIFFLINTILALISFIFIIDWTNWRKYIYHISAVVSVSIFKILMVIFKQIKQKFQK